MSAVSIRLPDGKELEFDHEPTVLEVAERIGPRLAKDVVAAQLNNEAEVVDFRTHLKNGTKLKIITTSSPEATEVMRHTAAHVMAQAVQELWPDVKVTIGPVIEDGFYYDFESPRPFTPEDLIAIEKKMAEVIKRDQEIVRKEMPSQEARKMFEKMGETYKLELIDGINEPTVGVYTQGDWFDLCRGPHLRRTGQIKAFKLLSIAGSYWRGDEKRQQLQRIYATAFSKQQELDDHLKRIEEAKKRDHRLIGKEMELFAFHPWAPGSPFFTGKGSVIYNQLQDYLREMYQETGYDEVLSPMVFDAELFRTSGHLLNYSENMYRVTAGDPKTDVPMDAGLKPMNCPGHCLLFGSTKHSYRELPIRYADFGRLHRYERAGVMHGISRVRSFCQDDGHIFCMPNQVQKEIVGFMKLLIEVYNKLGLNDIRIVVATRPEKRMGSDESWDFAEGALEEALKTMNLDYKLAPGEGAFYGPKIEVHIVDALKRPWQCGTIQVDPNLPEAFKLEYVGEDNAAHRPVMLHRAILGSLERFISIYLETVAGHLPVWLAPTQAVIMNITSNQNAYGEEVLSLLKKRKIRAKFDDRNEKLGFKIREAQIQRVPYMLVIGDKEVQERKLTLRLRDGAQVAVGLDQFIESISEEVANRTFRSPYLEQPKLTNVEGG